MGAPSETTADEDELAPTVDAERGAPTVPLELRKGAVLGGAYRVLRRLGQGGMGTVYLVEHTELGRRFAAKVVSRALSESAAQRLLNEAKVTSGIDHENIVDVVNLGRQPDGAIFVIMELLEGEDLGRRLDRQLEEEDGDPWLPDEELQAYVPQMLDGLAAAHAAGVIHRDLKPDNVFLARRDDGRVILKLLDFGIAKNVEPDGDQRLTRTGQIIGTPLYMAPEQARNMSDADVRADIYSVGVILYEMITGAPPFEADTLFDLILQHATEPPVPPSDRRPQILPSVESVILRCLAKDRDMRFDTVGDLRAAWDQAWLGIEPAPVVPKTVATSVDATPALERRASEPTPTAAPSGPPWMALSAFAITVALGLGGVIAWRLGVLGEPGATPTPEVEVGPVAADPVEVEPPPVAEPVATVTRIVQTEPQGATVTRDGQELGTTPLNLTVPVDGALSVRVSMDGYEPRWVDVHGDSADRLDVTLDPIPAPRGAPSRRRASVTAATPEPPAVTEASPPPVAPTAPPAQRPSRQILLGMDQFEAEQHR